MVPRWSPLRPASAAMAVLLLPMVVPAASAAPTVVFSDGFESGLGQWEAAAFVTADAACGTASGSKAAHFAGGGGIVGVSQDRLLQTPPLDLQGSTDVSYWFNAPTGGDPGFCWGAWDVKGPEGTVLFEYSTDGVAWRLIHSHHQATSGFVQVSIALPPEASSPATRLRWHQPTHNYAQEFAIDDVLVTTDPSAVSRPEPIQVPGTSRSETVPGQDVDTPPSTIPATCTLAQCHAETPLVDTPPATVPATCTVGPCRSETPLVTPAQPVPETCVPPMLPLLCLGPFTIPSQDLGDVPAVCGALAPVCIGPVTVPGQDTGNAPAVCDAAGRLCVGPIPVPAQDVAETDDITVAVGFTGLEVLADPHAAELTAIGPFTETVPVPVIGDVPVTVCPATCPFPVSPEGETMGSLTITVIVGSEQRSVTVPLDASA
jgi:hypothetical protein